MARPGPWLPPRFRVIAQRGDTFADRLQNAWTDTGGPTLQIGMDTPQVTAELLDASMAALVASPGAVLGHADDGGWWALGMLRAHTGVFRDIPMSTPAPVRSRRNAFGPWDSVRICYHPWSMSTNGATPSR